MLRVVEIFGLLGVALSIPASRHPTLQAIPSPAVHDAIDRLGQHVGPAVPDDLTVNAEDAEDAEEIAKLASNICSQGCEGIPEGSFWSWAAPIMLERGRICSGKPGGEDRHCSNEPGDMAKKQFDSLVQKLLASTSSARLPGMDFLRLPSLAPRGRSNMPPMEKRLTHTMLLSE